MSTNRPLHLLVTAGPTREKIDEVRDWGNIFTGRTGLDVALAFLELGDVTLLTSNDSHARDFDGYSGKSGMMGVETFRTHADLHDLLKERMTSGDAVDVVAMTAAVADYQPEAVYRVISRKPAADGRETWEVQNVSAPKVKSSHDEVAVLARRTLKLVDQFRSSWKYRGVLIKFKLEVGIPDDELIRVAGASRLASGAELMVANTLEMARSVRVGGNEPGAFLIDDQSVTRVGRAELAQRIAGWVKARLGPRQGV